MHIYNYICNIELYREGDLSLDAMRAIDAIFAYIALYVQIESKIAKS